MCRPTPSRPPGHPRRSSREEAPHTAAAGRPRWTRRRRADRMCGIVGYVGPREATPVLIDGLRRLEYRGYDSAGVAVLGDDGSIQVSRSEGKLRNLIEKLAAS